MKTYLKTLGRMFSHHITRFLSIIFIVLLAVGFSSGIGSAIRKFTTCAPRIPNTIVNWLSEKKQ